MNAAEYKAWSDYMRASRGLWTIDPVHNGKERDLIAFRPDMTDPSRGVCVVVDGPTIWAGGYEDGEAGVTDGLVRYAYGVTLLDGADRTKSAGRKPTEAASRTAFKRLGVGFLLDLIQERRA